MLLPVVVVTAILLLNCSFVDVCELDICASIGVNVTLSGIINENGDIGEDPKMDMEACVDTNVEFLEKMCLRLDFAKPDFFVPIDCSFTYGSMECNCKVDPSEGCYDFDCSFVVPAPLNRAIVPDACKTVNITEQSLDAKTLLPKEVYV